MILGFIPCYRIPLAWVQGVCVRWCECEISSSNGIPSSPGCILFLYFLSLSHLVLSIVKLQPCHCKWSLPIYSHLNVIQHAPLSCPSFNRFNRTIDTHGEEPPFARKHRFRAYHIQSQDNSTQALLCTSQCWSRGASFKSSSRR